MRPELLITKPPRGPADCVTGTTAAPPAGACPMADGRAAKAGAGSV
jgi:hypothetical protein